MNVFSTLSILKLIFFDIALIFLIFTTISYTVHHNVKEDRKKNRWYRWLIACLVCVLIALIIKICESFFI